MTEETLFHEALSKLPIDRAAFLDEKCAGKPALRAAVEALLAAHDASGSFLNKPANPLEETVDSEPGPVEHGATGEFTPEPDSSANAGTDHRQKVDASQVIGGRYTLLQKIGEGGMGEVWVAQQTEPVKRKVALKLIKTGMDSRGVLARFEQERQALAIMDHPNIARVLDGGMTPTGQPFFVMELVNGLALTRFCDEARLTPRQRLELFIPICQAVQHAHQKGVVHRDLKPANILITMIDGRPVPKVIDFGVAKATAGEMAEEAMTQFGAVVGTLEYMSPEQAGFSGVDIDTRADIYSLGVILYELLTGLRPFDAKRLKQAALNEVIRIIQEEEPSKPSTRLSTDEALPSLAAVRQTEPNKLMAELRGELDWVVMKCLEKQRDRRYETANGLARDIQRYLTDEPVEARPPSVGYRLQKMLRRNRVAVFSVGAVAAALLIGIVAATWQAVRATNAETEERKAKVQAETLVTANAKLAADENKAKLAAEKLADDNKKLADDERDAKNKAVEATQEKNMQLLRTKSILFTSHMNRAKEIREKDPHLALGMLYDLGKCPVEFRDLSWNYSVHALRHQLVASVQLPPSNNDVPVAWSPDGKLFATHNSGGTWGKQIWLVDVETGKVRAAFPESVACREYSSLLLAFSPDGSKLAVAADGSSTSMPKGALIPKDVTSLAPGTVQIWDVMGVKKLATLEGHTDGLLALTFSPDNTRLATGSLDNTARIWDLKTAKETHVIREHGKQVGAISFSPDGKRLATGGGDNTIKLWDVDGFKLRNTWAIAPGPTAPENQKKGAPDAGKALDANKELHGIRVLQFSPDGATLASSCASQPLEFRNVATGVVYSTNRELKTPLRSLVFHRDGQSVLTTSADEPWKARLFTLTGQQLRVFPGRLVDGSGFLKERSLIATNSGGLCKIWDLDLPLESATIALDQAVDFPPPAVFGLSGDVLAVGEQERIILHDVRTGEVRQTLKGHKARVTALALSPDGRTLASSGPALPASAGEVRLWDFTTGESLGTVEIESGVTALAFSPDGSTLALLHQVPFGKAPVVSLWDVTARKSLGILEFPKGEVYVALPAQQGTIAFNPADGKLVTAVGHSLMIWNTKTRALEQHILTKSADAKLGGTRFYDMAISPDGKSIATLAVQPPGMSELALWDPANGMPIAKTPLQPKFSSPTYRQSVAFSPSGRELITCVGGEIQFWDVLSLQERAMILDAGNPYQKPIIDAKRGSAPRWSRAILSPDGRVLATLPHLSPSSPGNDPKKPAQIELWDLSRPEVLLKLPGTATMLFSPDSKTLIEHRTDGVIRFWDLGTGSVVTEVNTAHQAIGSVLSPDGRYLIGTDFEGPEEEAKRYLNFGRTGDDPNNKKQGTFNGYITLWDIQTRKLRRIDIGKGAFRFPPLHSPVGNSLAFVRDASLGDKVDIAVEVWDLAQERMTIRFPLPQFTPLDKISMFSPDGNTFAILSAGFVRLFDLQNKSELDPLPVPAMSGPTKIRFTNDGKRLVLRQDLGMITKQTLWDWRAGKQVDEPIPDLFDVPITSPDGRYELVRRFASLEVEVIDRMAKPAVPRQPLP